VLFLTALARGFKKKPAPALGLIDPIFEQAGRRKIVALIANAVNGPH